MDVVPVSITGKVYKILFVNLCRRICVKRSAFSGTVRQTARQTQRIILIFIAAIHLQVLFTVDIGHLLTV